ncbi:hypothetical protein [Neobacillus drentensis]|nr:hypothetical protein [Neobacillus drentensis]
MNHEGVFLMGLVWGVSLRITLWISLIGWVELILRFFCENK